MTSIAPPLRLPLVRNDTYRKAAREAAADSQGSLDI